MIYIHFFIIIVSRRKYIYYSDLFLGGIGRVRFNESSPSLETLVVKSFEFIGKEYINARLLVE